MKVLHVKLDNSRDYPIYIGSGLLEQADLLTRHILSKQVAIVSNETIAPLYLAKLQAALPDHQVETVILPDGEQYKTLQYLEKIFDQLLAAAPNFDLRVFQQPSGLDFAAAGRAVHEAAG